MRPKIPVLLSLWILPACPSGDPADLVGTATESASAEGTSGSTTSSSSATPEPEPEPEPETAGSACGGALAGQWGDCINGNAGLCGNEDASCLSNSTTNPAWGTCTLPCEDRCDCWAAPGVSAAEPACAPVLAMGGRACVLECSEGRPCPDGMSCRALTGVLSICAFDYEDFDPTGGPDPSTSTGASSSSGGTDTDTDTGSSSSGGSGTSTGTSTGM